MDPKHSQFATKIKLFSIFLESRFMRNSQLVVKFLSLLNLNCYHNNMEYNNCEQQKFTNHIERPNMSSAIESIREALIR